MAMSASVEEMMEFDSSMIVDETLVEFSRSIMYRTDFPNSCIRTVTRAPNCSLVI